MRVKPLEGPSLSVNGISWSCPPECDDETGIIWLNYERGEREPFARAPWEHVSARHRSGRTCVKAVELT